MKRLVALFLALLISSPAAAQWQVPRYSVPIGHGGGTTGFDSAVPGTAGVPLVSKGAAINPAFAPVQNVGIAPGAANTAKGSLDGATTSDLTLVSCTLAYQITRFIAGTGWQCGVLPVLPSRAIALALNLSAFSAVQTMGYTLPGDGGGATFQKLLVGVPFQDSFINTATLVGGSGYVSGTYAGVPLGGSIYAAGCFAQVVVSGGVVTQVNRAVPCASAKVGDVYIIANSFLGGAGSGFTWTVATVSTPQASFTDTVGTNFQFVPDQAGYANLLQFGAKGDWVGTDLGATNNAAALWSAATWASVTNFSSSAQVSGNLVLIPKGAYMTCGAWLGGIYNFPLPQGVRFSGVGVGGTTLVQCSSDSSGTHYIELCDSNFNVGQFGCKIENMTINLAQVTTSTSGFAAVYSKAGQQFVLGQNLEIQPGARSCIKYETGLGGAANDTWWVIDCEQLAGTTNPGFVFNSSGTQHYLLHSVAGCGGLGGCTLAINHLAGRLSVNGLDIEAFVTGLNQNVSVSGNTSTYENVQQNSNNCTQAITLQSTNTPGNIVLKNVATGCPLVINNGQAGGANYNSTIRGSLMCVGNPCAAAVP